MNKKQENNMTQAELELLVGKYFDCETTEEEEIVLKRALSECRFRSSIIDEALVAMGFYSIGRERNKENNSSKRISVAWRVASVAAMLVLIVSFALKVMQSDSIDETDYCIAYVNGVEVDDQEEVLALVRSSLNNMGNTTEMEAISMESQFSNIREIMSMNDNKD